MTLKQVHAGGEAGRQQLTDFVAEHRLGYWHDPFLDEWRISRPTTANLFAEVAGRLRLTGDGMELAMDSKYGRR